jgi:hypothetical protein
VEPPSPPLSGVVSENQAVNWNMIEHSTFKKRTNTESKNNRIIDDTYCISTSILFHVSIAIIYFPAQFGVGLASHPSSAAGYK